MNRLSRLTILTLALGGSGLFAHHLFTSEYDIDRPVTIKGTVKAVDWGEPHVGFVVTDSSSSMPQDWKFEGASASTLDHREWNSANRLRVGDVVSVQGYRALDGTMSGSARSVQVPDGRLLSISDSQEDGGPAPVLTSGTIPVQLPRMGIRLPLLTLAGLAVAFFVFLMMRHRRSA